MSFNLKNYFSNNVKVSIQTINSSQPAQSVHLNLDDKLSKIRKEFEKDELINDIMLFLEKINGKFSQISLEKEQDFLLKEIIEIINENQNILHLRCSRPDWRYLNDKCKLDYGCTMSFNGIKKANKRAFMMKNCELTELGAEEWVQMKIG